MNRERSIRAGTIQIKVDMSQNDIHTLNMENKIEEYCTANTGNLLDEQFSIYRVPAHIRKNNESYYEPRMVSIGPYHQGKEHLRAMQDHKWRYLVDYIKQGKGKKEDYIEQIRKMETSIRACYFESFDIDKEKFVETILLDSCFIIQFFLKWRFEQSDQARNMGWALPLLMADLIMMENQIPYNVLEKMYNIYSLGCIDPFNKKKKGCIDPDNPGNKPKLTKLLVESIHAMHHTNKERDPELLEDVADIKHLLHLYYLLFVPNPENITTTVPNSPILPYGCHIVPLQVCISLAGYCGSKETREEERSPRMIPSLREKERSPRMIPSVTELKEYGVKFKKKKNFKSILDISFKNGVLEIPYIVLEESIRSKFLNLIAFEQCISTDKKHLTSYAVFMDCLINTPEDVIVLQRRGIIENKLADTTEVAKFFKQLRDCAYMEYDDHYLKQVFVDITKHRRAFWPKHGAKLWHDHFSSPWSIFAFLVASLLLIITIFKTIYFIITTF